MTVHVGFRLEIGGAPTPDCFDDTQLLAPDADLGPFTDQDAYGRVKITADGLPDFEVKDALDNLVPALCLQSIPQLVEGERVDVALEAYYGRVTLAPAGDTVRIETNNREGPIYPAAALLRALLECGQRYAVLARRAVAAGGYAVNSLGTLDADLAAAEQAVAGLATPTA